MTRIPLMILFKMCLLMFGCARSSLLHGLCLVAASGGYSLVVVLRLLISVASLIVEHGLLGTKPSVVAAHGLGRCGFWALEHRISSCGAQA